MHGQVPPEKVYEPGDRPNAALLSSSEPLVFLLTSIALLFTSFLAKDLLINFIYQPRDPAFRAIQHTRQNGRTRRYHDEEPQRAVGNGKFQQHRQQPRQGKKGAGS